MTRNTIAEVISPYNSSEGQSNLKKTVASGLEFKSFMNQEVYKGLSKDLAKVSKQKEPYNSSILDKDSNKTNVDPIDSPEGTANISKLDDKESIHNSEEVQDYLEDLSLQLKAMLLEKFEITEEELVQAMETLGIGYLDLLNVENLSKLALDLIGGEDMISLISNEELCVEYMNLLEAMTELTNDVSSGLDLSPEEMTKLIDILEVQEETLDIALEQISQKEDATSLTNEKTFTFNEEADSKTKAMDSLKDASVIEDGNEVNKQNLGVESEKEGSFGKNEESGLNNPDSMIGQSNYQNTIIQNEEYLTETIDTQDIIRQVVDEIKITVKANITNMELQLNPEHLGKLTINISSREEMITAQIIAQNHTVKEALETQIASLRENLNNQGVKVDAIEVTVESHAFESNLQEGGSHSNQSQETARQARRQINIGTLEEDLADFTEAETLTADMMLQNGNSVDYIA